MVRRYDFAFFALINEERIVQVLLCEPAGDWFAQHKHISFTMSHVPSKTGHRKILTNFFLSRHNKLNNFRRELVITSNAQS